MKTSSGLAAVLGFAIALASVSAFAGGPPNPTMSDATHSTAGGTNALFNDTGFYNTVPAGTQWYVTWSMSGNNLYLSGSFVSYPPSAATGPFAPSGQAQ